LREVHLLGLIISLLWMASAAAQEHWRAVSGSALTTLFADKEFADGAHFAYRLKSDGTFTGTEMAKEVSGTWRVVGEQLCWSWERPPGPRECYDVQQDRANVRLLINGSEAWYGTVERMR